MRRFTQIISFLILTAIIIYMYYTDKKFWENYSMESHISNYTSEYMKVNDQPINIYIGIIEENGIEKVQYFYELPKSLWEKRDTDVVILLYTFSDYDIFYSKSISKKQNIYGIIDFDNGKCNDLNLKIVVTNRWKDFGTYSYYDFKCDYTVDDFKNETYGSIIKIDNNKIHNLNHLVNMRYNFLLSLQKDFYIPILLIALYKFQKVLITFVSRKKIDTYILKKKQENGIIIYSGKSYYSITTNDNVLYDIYLFGFVKRFRFYDKKLYKKRHEILKAISKEC